jgi:hypothetical protein
MDSIQQTIATILRSYINSPTISRKEVMSALQLLSNEVNKDHVKREGVAADLYCYIIVGSAAGKVMTSMP